MTHQKPVIIFIKNPYILYESRGQIGSGKNSTVIQALCKQTNQNVAIKVIPNTQQFEFESKIKIKHENILQTKKIFKYEQNIYLILQLCQNTFAKLLQEKSPMNYEELLNYGYQIIKGLNYLHKNMLVHRDLKPENILVKNNILKICDFSQSKFNLEIYQPNLGSYVGNQKYMDPSRLKNENYSGKCDVWGFGILFYQMIFGKYLFSNSKQRNQVKQLWKHQQQFFKNGFQPIVFQLNDFLRNILQITLKQKQEDRVTFKDLQYIFQQQIKDYNIYKELKKIQEMQDFKQMQMNQIKLQIQNLNKIQILKRTYFNYFKNETDKQINTKVVNYLEIQLISRYRSFNNYLEKIRKSVENKFVGRMQDLLNQISLIANQIKNKIEIFKNNVKNKKIKNLNKKNLKNIKKQIILQLDIMNKQLNIFQTNFLVQLIELLNSKSQNDQNQNI